MSCEKLWPDQTRWFFHSELYVFLQYFVYKLINPFWKPHFNLKTLSRYRNSHYKVTRDCLIFTMGKTATLTHWDRANMAAIFWTTFWNAFSWMKMYEFRLTCHWYLSLRVKLIISHHLFRWWLGADQATSHYLNQWCYVYWRIYASLGLNELT